MARYETHFYVSSVAAAAVAAWAASTSYSVGQIVRQNATPAVGAERCFICVVAGTSGGSEPSWTTTWGGSTTDNSVTWRECSGLAGLNNDTANTVDWATYKANYAGTSNGGQLIKNNAGTHLFMITTGAGALGANEPTWNTTTGATTADSTTTWTCLGAVGSFGTWAAPLARLVTAFSASSWGSSGGGKTVFIADNSAETQSSGNPTLNFASTRLNPAIILSIANGSTSRPPTSADLSVGASVNCTTSTGSIIWQGGAFFCYGVTTNSNGTGFSAWQVTVSCRMKYCTLKAANAGKNGQAVSLNATGPIVLEDCSFDFGSTGDYLAPGGNARVRMTNPSFLGTAYPTSWMIPTSGAEIEVIGGDLSSFGSGKTLVNITGSVKVWGHFERCKLNASVTKVGGTGANIGSFVDFINCDSGNTNYNYERFMEAGTLTTETTIVRDGGASDGAQDYAWKIVTNASGIDPWSGSAFECPPMVVWNGTTGSDVTVTVYGIWGGGAVPTDNDVWMEVEYFGDASSPKGTVKSSQRLTPLHAVQDLASDSSTWGGSTTKFKMQVTLTSPQPQKDGPIYVRVFVGKESSTFYIDPKPVLS